MSARLLRAVLAAAVLLGLGGCGVPQDTSPRAIDRSAVPFGLLDGQHVDRTAQPSGPPGFVYFVNNGRLTPVKRPVGDANRTAGLLRALLSGPDDKDTSAGITTAIPARTRLLSLDVEGSTATLDLSREFGDVAGRDQVAAVAQLVYTTTESRRVDAVQFSVAGKPVEVPDGSGSLSTAPRTRYDYRALAPAR